MWSRYLPGLKALVFLSVLLACSYLAYSQEKSPILELTPYENLTKILETSPAKAPNPENNSTPLVLRLANRLESWDLWSIALETCVKETLSLLRKQDEAQKRKSEADEQLIGSLRLENKLLKDALKQAGSDKTLVGVGSFAAGYFAGVATGWSLKK